MRALASVIVLAAAACSEDPAAPGVDLTQPPVVDVDVGPAPLLSAYNLFAWDAATSTFAFNPTGERIAPYELNTALFSDFALKQRALYVPPGAASTYDGSGVFELPVGSAIVKTFAFPADLRDPAVDVTLVETRLLMRAADAWKAYVYIWDADQQDAVLSPAGETRDIAFVDATGTARTAHYQVPQHNQCESCHARERAAGGPVEKALPIGIAARHLNRDGQLEQMATQGLLAGLPSAAELPVATDFRAIEANGVGGLDGPALDRAARDYLDINCAHCHNPRATQGMTSQLYLNHDNTDQFRLGVCKRPGSAGPGNGGLDFDIVPGAPDESILLFRLHTDQVGAMMPLLGRSLTHERGSELVRAWIAGMPANDCVTPSP